VQPSQAETAGLFTALLAQGVLTLLINHSFEWQMRRTSLQLKQEVMRPGAAFLCYQIYSTFCHLFPEIQLKTSKPSAQSPLCCSEVWTTSFSPRKPSDQISFPPQCKSGHIYAEYFLNIFIHRICRISSASCLPHFKSAINFK